MDPLLKAASESPLPPLPVSGCIPGSIHNRVTYSETDSETVQQSLSITVSRTWMQSHGTSSSV